MVHKIHDIVLTDCRVKIREIAIIVKISIERVPTKIPKFKIMHKKTFSQADAAIARNRTKMKSNDNFERPFRVASCCRLIGFKRHNLMFESRKNNSR